MMKYSNSGQVVFNTWSGLLTSQTSVSDHLEFSKHLLFGTSFRTLDGGLYIISQGVQGCQIQHVDIIIYIFWHIPFVCIIYVKNTYNFATHHYYSDIPDDIQVFW